MKKSLVYTLLAFAAIIWGISFILTKQLFATEPHITVFIILTFRLLLATAVTIPPCSSSIRWSASKKAT